MLMRFYLPISRKVRQMSTKQKMKLTVTMDEETYKMIDTEVIKPRHHAGKVVAKAPALPPWLCNALKIVLEDSPLSTINTDSVKFANYLNARHPPAEIADIQTKYSKIRDKMMESRQGQNMDDQSMAIVHKKEEQKSLKILKESVYAWSPIQYNRYSSILYLISRSAQEYAVLHRIFNEITTRDKNFRPTSMFDFGSGVGTALWASSQLWSKSIREYMCVDISTEMNDLSESIISHADPKLKAIYYRQYMPLAHRTYDIVVSAYSLLELPNMQIRLSTIEKLWAKTERYLVIVEQGSNAGFKIINEARDFLLHMQHAREQTSAQTANIFSPCPHNKKCPRYKLDNTPCNFELPFNPLGLNNKYSQGSERFSYVVFQKGESSEETSNWPRIVRPILFRSKHIICRMCTEHGKLSEIIFTKEKHGKWMYRCVKGSQWGDRLPIQIEEEPVIEESVAQEELAKVEKLEKPET